MKRSSLRVSLLVCLFHFFAMQGFTQQGGQGNNQKTQESSQGNAASQQQGKGNGNQSSVKSSGYTPFDSFPVTIQAQSFGVLIPTECQDPGSDINTAADMLKSFAVSADSKVKPACILEMVSTAMNAPVNGVDTPADLLKAAAQLPTPGNGVIVHVITWQSKKVSDATSEVPAKPATATTPAQPEVPAKYAVYSFQPQHGVWGFYVVKKDRKNLSQQTDASGTPYFYNAKHLYLVDINLIDNFDPNAAEIDYTIQGTARQKQNQADLATLANALLKVKTGTFAASNVNPTIVWGVVQEVEPGIPVPYDLAVTVSLNPPKQAGSSAKSPCAQSSSGTKGGQSSQSACSVSKTVTNYDPEYWDVSLGLAIPGPVETTYKSSSTGGSTTVTPNKVTHTDAYAFADFYVFQKLSKSPAGFSNFPHFNVGIPITSQVFHRPYVGMAENLNFLTSKLKLGIPLSVFAGPVFMKQQIELPGTTTLKWDRATKMIYGLELPISSITNYLKGGGSSSKGSGSSKNGSASNNGGGGTQ
jgi:hypothetical protein